MESLFKQEGAQSYVDRINLLSPQSKAVWGTMNVGQMLHHCQIPLQIATDQLAPKVNPVIKFLFGKSAKKSLLSKEPFKRGLPTLAEAKIKDDRNFEVEQKKLIELINSFHQKGPNGITKKDHPFFGGLSPADWDHMQSKHLDHHLQQFGV